MSGRPRGAWGAVLSGALAVAGVVVLLLALRHQQPAPPSVVSATPSEPVATVPHVPEASPPRSRPRPEAEPVPRAPRGPRVAREARQAEDPIRGPLLPESAPVRLHIPRLGVHSTLQRLGLGRSGTLEVPRDPAVAGWFTGAPSPGALGPAVMVGHVTWDGRPAVFFRLAELRRGDRVAVRRADHRTAVFAVRRVQVFDKDRFPTRAVYGRLDRAGLRLVTCGGRYDADRGRFADNVVVFADLLDVRTR